MVEQKTLNEIVQDLIIHIHDTLPDVDTKQGTFIRDVFIDPIADEFAVIYNQILLGTIKQSILTAYGEDLDAIAANYFVERKVATKSSGKLRFYINPYYINNNLLTEVRIPKGTIVSTVASITQTAIQVQTSVDTYYNINGILTLPIDTQGLKYIEIASEAVNGGLSGNVGANTLTQQLNNKNQIILGVNNPYSFSGGTSEENDTSLVTRIGLVITGNNIGTKNGYLNYILKQNGVVDAYIVGAGDPTMFRDGGYVDNTGKYIPGSAGMVDVYVRGELLTQDEFVFNITNEYVNGDNPYADIILLKQPGVNTVSVISSSGYNFINAMNYEEEKGSLIDNNGNLLEDVKYYQDLLWDFSIKDNFPDSAYYPLPPNLTNQQIADLKVMTDNELLNAMTYMSNINYSLNWSLMVPASVTATDFFVNYFYNNEVFKIVANSLNTNATLLSERTFVLRDNKIYVRIYAQPDYTLLKDILPTGNSIEAKDRIKWLNGIKPNENEVLTIIYNYNQLTETLQTGIDTVRCLTADVLIKEATELPVEVIINATCYSNYNPTTIKNNIITSVSDYINNIKKMGGTFDLSDIISTSHAVEGVDSVDTDTVSIAHQGYSPTKTLTAQPNEYFNVRNILVEVLSSNVINI